MKTTTTTLVRSLTAVLVATALAVTVAACGGDDDAEPAPADAAEGEPAAGTAVDSGADGSSEVETTAREPDEQPAAAGEAVATVTIGDLTYSFDLEDGPIAACSVFAGETFFGTGFDDAGSNVGFEFPTEGSARAAEATAFIIVNDSGSGSEWTAGTDDLRSFEPGTSQVDSVTVDGRTASGTATFIDATLDERVPITGSFEATCP